jgi:hypothetical protein
MKNKTFISVDRIRDFRVPMITPVMIGNISDEYRQYSNDIFSSTLARDIAYEANLDRYYLTLYDKLFRFGVDNSKYYNCIFQKFFYSVVNGADSIRFLDNIDLLKTLINDKYTVELINCGEIRNMYRVYQLKKTRTDLADLADDIYSLRLANEIPNQIVIPTTADSNTNIEDNLDVVI